MVLRVASFLAMQWGHYVQTTRKWPIDHVDLSGILIKGDKIEQGTRLLNWNFTILAVSVVHVRSSVTCKLYCFYLLLMSLQCPYWWFSNVICGMHHISCISPHKSCLYLKINSQIPSHGSGRTDGRTTDAKWWQKLTWPLARWAKNNRTRQKETWHIPK
jgi:hypothetical protein